MGFVSDLVSGLFGGRPKASGSAATSTVDADTTKANAVRAKLLETAGGQSGEELLSGTTKKRDTLLGN